MKSNPLNILAKDLLFLSIPFEDVTRGSHARLVYPDEENVRCSIIFFPSSYGYEVGKLEIMGLLTPEEKERDSVCGYLSEEEVLKRIYEDWRHFKNEYLH